MTKRKKRLIAAAAMLPVLFLMVWWLLLPRWCEFQIRHASKIDVFYMNPPPGRLVELSSDADEVRDIVRKVWLWRKRHSNCSFREEYIFRGWAGDVRVSMSNGTFIVHDFPGGEYAMPSGVWKGIFALREKSQTSATTMSPPLSQ